jgi:hypothetical protein
MKIGHDFVEVTTHTMEAMIIVGLCLGSFVKGPDHDLPMKTFIKHVAALAPIIKERRKSMRADTQFFLCRQRETLFALWSIEMKTWNARRTDDGKFSPIVNGPFHDMNPVLKKQRKDKFDFSILREDHVEANVCSESTEV